MCTGTDNACDVRKRVVPTGRGNTEDEVFLAGQPYERPVVGGQHRGVRRCTLRGRQPAQACTASRVQRERRLRRSAQRVGGPLLRPPKSRGRVGTGDGAVDEHRWGMGGVCVRSDEGGVFAESAAQVRQLRRPSRGQPVVDGHEVLSQENDAIAVGDRVMAMDQQRELLRRQLEEAQSRQWPAGGVEPVPAFFGDALRYLLRPDHLAGDPDGGRGGDLALHRWSLLGRDRHAEHKVTSDQAVGRLLEQRDVQGALDAEAADPTGPRLR